MRLLAILMLLLTPFGPAAQAQAQALAPLPVPPKPAAAVARPGEASGPTPTTTLTPGQAQAVLDVLRDDKKRAAFATVLESMVQAMPAAEPAGAKLAPDSLGAEVLAQGSTWLAGLADEVTTTVQVASDLPLLGDWLVTTVSDPGARGRVFDAMWKLALVFGSALLVERGVRRALAGPRKAIERRAPANDTFEPVHGTGGLDAAEQGETEMQDRRRRFSHAWRTLRRLPYVLAYLMLELLPLGLFAALGHGLLGIPQLSNILNSKLTVVVVLNAYLACRAAMCVTRMFVAPYHPQLRLVNCTDETALFVTSWVRRLALVGVFGFALAAIGQLFGLYRAAHDTVLKMVSLVIHLMLIVIVLETRATVAAHLRARRRQTGLIATLLNRLASTWHIVVIFYIVALWVVSAAEIEDGYRRLLHFAVLTTVVMTLSRLVSIVLLGALDRGVRVGPELAARYPGLEQRASRYHPVLRAMLSAALVIATLVVLLEVWGLGPLAYFTTGQLGERVVSALVTCGLAALVGLAVWEAVNAGIENHLATLTRQAQAARSARLRTLLPMLRTALSVTLLTVVALVVLSEVGVNIAPLLAGAGVLGLAIGFGSQKLVQDLITGLFLLLENTMQVGDVVALGGLTGTVENLSIRTIRLRAQDGAVHIIPFSSVTTVTNQTRDFAYALVDVEVGFDEQPDRVSDLLREIVAGMRAEPRWQDIITAELEVMGVQAFEASAWLLRVRIRTTASQRWPVTREFNRRIKYRFDELAVQSPLTSYRVQGWMPPGAERPLPKPDAPKLAEDRIERAAE